MQKCAMPSTSPADRREPQNILRAAAWMALALASFTLLAVAGRKVTALFAAADGRTTPDFGDTFQLMFFRSVIALVIMVLVIAMSREGWAQVRSRKLGLHGVRNVIHFLGQFSWFHALSLIPLAQLFAIEFTNPIWVALFAPLLLGERMSRLRALAVVLGFAGILIIVQPGGAPLNLGHALALTAAISFAGSMIATRQLMATDTGAGFLFHMAWMQLPIALVLAAPYLRLPGLELSIWLLVLGLGALLAHFALAKAFAAAEAIVVAPMDFLRLPLIALIGVFVYDEALGWSVLLGGAIVIAANAINLLAERQSALARRAAQAATPGGRPQSSPGE